MASGNKRDPSASHDSPTVEGRDCRHDLDGSAAYGVDEADVDDGHGGGAPELREWRAGPRQAVGSQVGDGRSSQRKNERVQQPRRQVLERDPDQLGGETLGVAPKDVRRRTHRNSNASSAALRQIDGDLGAAVARADNQHVLAAIRSRIAVFRGMNHRPIECAWPSRQIWHAGIPAGHHDYPRGNRASGRPDLPVAVITVNPRGLDSEPWLEAVVRRVLLQILHELVACHPAAELARNPVARKVRQPADGVQVQTVVAGAPLLSDVLAPLQDGGVYATRPQCRRGRQSRRTSADDDDIVHSQKATAQASHSALCHRPRPGSTPRPCHCASAFVGVHEREDPTVQLCGFFHG